METSNFFTPQEQNAVNKPTNDECNLALLTHVLAIFTAFLGPLIIYIIKRDESPFVRENARNALNFQISLLIYYFIAGILVVLLVGVLFIAALYVINLIFCILAAVAARDGKIYKYPLTIQFLK